MFNTTDFLTFNVPLTAAAYRLAQQFGKRQNQPEQARQIYLNTLAVYAVNYYCQCLEIETDLEKGDSWNPVMQTLTDVADLEIKNVGKLECRPVLPGEKQVYMPQELWEDRIGCIAVEIDDKNREATLLGFVKTAATDKISRNQFQSLEVFIEQLPSQQELVPEVASPQKVLVNLRKWLTGVFESDWQPAELVLATSFRKVANLEPSEAPALNQGICRAKAINLGMQLAGQSVAMVMRLKQVIPGDMTLNSLEEIDVRLRLYPVEENSYLPSGIKLLVLDDSGVVSMEAIARSADNWIQLNFGAMLGEQFSVEVALGDAKIRENFLV